MLRSVLITAPEDLAGGRQSRVATSHNTAVVSRTPTVVGGPYARDVVCESCELRDFRAGFLTCRSLAAAVVSGARRRCQVAVVDHP